jgi:hypothetical protein
MIMEPSVMTCFTLTSQTADRLMDFLKTESPEPEPVQIIVDAARTRFEDLAVLREAARTLVTGNRRFHIAGVPACLWQRHIGGGGYTRLLQAMEPEPVFPSAAGMEGRSLLLSCQHCQTREACPGLGSLPENPDPLLFRLRKEEQMEAWRPVRFEDATLDRMYRTFLAHVEGCDNAVADRSMMFARTFSVGRPAQYAERFVYYCCFMPPADIPVEKRLLCETLRNGGYVSDVFERYYRDNLVATVNCTFTAGDLGRESLYLYFDTPDKMRAFAAEKGVPLSCNAFENPYVIAVDFYHGAVAGYKVYFRIRDKDLFRQYIEREVFAGFGAWFWEIAHTHELTRRFDAGGRYAGCKIGFGSRHPEAVRQEVHTRFGMDFGPAPADRVVHSFSLDVSLEGTVNKSTVYERSWYKGFDKDYTGYIR